MKASIRGGDLDGQHVFVELKRENDSWKIDLLESVEVDGRLRAEFDRQLGRVLLESDMLEGGAGGERRLIVDCALARMRGSFPNGRVADWAEGRLEPDEFEKQLKPALLRCLPGLDDGDRQLFEGSAYRLRLPERWKDVTTAMHELGFDLPEAVLAGETIDGFGINVVVISEPMRWASRSSSTWTPAGRAWRSSRGLR